MTKETKKFKLDTIHGKLNRGAFDFRFAEIFRLYKNRYTGIPFGIACQYADEIMALFNFGAYAEPCTIEYVRGCIDTRPTFVRYTKRANGTILEDISDLIGICNKPAKPAE